jgi:hypothetical protein
LQRLIDMFPGEQVACFFGCRGEGVEGLDQAVCDLGAPVAGVAEGVGRIALDQKLDDREGRSQKATRADILPVANLPVSTMETFVVRRYLWPDVTVSVCSVNYS